MIPLDNIQEFYFNNCLMCAKHDYCYWRTQILNGEINEEGAKLVGVISSSLFGNTIIKCKLLTITDDDLPF